LSSCLHRHQWSDKVVKTATEIHFNELSESQECHVCDLCVKTKQKHFILRQSQWWATDICKIMHINVVDIITSVDYNNSCWYTVCMNDYIHVWHITLWNEKKTENDQTSCWVSKETQR
jgi:hypothetical protein